MTPEPFAPTLPPGHRFQMKVPFAYGWRAVASYATLDDATEDAQKWMDARSPFRVVDENGAVLIYYRPPE